MIVPAGPQQAAGAQQVLGARHRGLQQRLAWRLWPQRFTQDTGSQQAAGSQAAGSQHVGAQHTGLQQARLQRREQASAVITVPSITNMAATLTMAKRLIRSPFKKN